MPRVPSFVPQVGLSTGQGPQLQAPGTAPVQDGTARNLQGLAQGAMTFGVSVSRIGADMADEHTDTVLRERDNRLQEVIRQRLESQDGYLNKVGKAAVGETRERVLEDLRNDFEELTDDLSPFERQVFGKVAMSRWQTAVGRIDEHEVKQHRAWSIGETTARAQSMADQAFAAAGTDDWHVHYGTMRNELERLADLAGLPEDSEQRNSLVLEASTKLHERVVASLAQRDPAAAAKHLQRAEERGELRHGAEKELREIVDRASTSDASLRLAQEFAGVHRTTEGGIDLAAAEARLSEQFQEGKITAQVYDATLERLGRTDRIGRESHARDLNAAVDQATAWLAENPLRGVADLPPDLFVRLKNSGALDTVNRFADGGRYSTDPQAFYEAMQLPADELRRVSQAEVYRQFRGRLGDAELSKVMARHAAANQRADSEQTFLLSVQDRLNNAANKMLGFEPGRTLDAAESEKKFRLTQRLEERLQQYEQQVLGGTRKANPKEFQDVLDRVALDRVLIAGTGYFTDDSAPAIVVMDDPERARLAYIPVGAEEVYLKQIPKAVQTMIQQDIEASGGEISEQGVAELWVRTGKPKDAEGYRAGFAQIRAAAAGSTVAPTVAAPQPPPLTTTVRGLQVPAGPLDPRNYWDPRNYTNGRNQ